MHRSPCFASPVTRSLFPVILSSLILVTPGLVTPSLAATFTVAHLDDSGAGSLRQAILDANAAAGEDTIEFANGVAGTLELASALPEVTDSLNLFGPGFDVVTIDANQHGRVFLFGGSGALTYVVEELTLTGGLVDEEDGGGIEVFSQKELTLDSVHVTGNQAVDGVGGGVYMNFGSTLLVQRSVIAGNEARNGGGLFAGDLIVQSSTIYDNRAQIEGGGVWSNGLVQIFESTITRNRVESEVSISFGGGVNVQNGGSLVSFQSTITDNWASNGPGVRIWPEASVMDVAATIIANNRFLGTGDEGNCSQDLGVTDRHNLSDTLGCGFTGASDFEEVEPRLFGLAFTFGATPTQVPAPSSPVIDAGNNDFCLAVDQRGLPRPVDGAGDPEAICDIGAVEYQPFSDAPVFYDDFESGDTSAWTLTVP